jgi:alkylation response protein AidB-like acyl-CoA dehydrogenase
MDLTLSNEQQMLAEALSAFVSRECDANAVRELEASDRGYSTAHWAGLGQIGVPGLMIPEEFGGAGKGLTEMAVACQELGRAPVPGPVVSSSVLATTLLLAAGTTQQQAAWLPTLADGTRTATVAILEPSSRNEWEVPATTFTRDGDMVRINGTKILVPYAASSEAVIVTGLLDGQVAGVVLDVRTVSPDLRRQHDGGGDAVFEARFVDNRVGQDALMLPDAFTSALDRSLQAAAVAAIAYAVGGARRSLDLVVDHASNRVQFGRPIGAFQAVSHRCVDIHCDVEAVEYLCWQAAATFDSPRGRDAVSAAKGFASDAVRRVYTNAHQVMGAIGYSMEHELQLHSRRGKVFELSYGGSAFHYDRVARAMSLG